MRILKQSCRINLFHSVSATCPRFEPVGTSINLKSDGMRQMCKTARNSDQWTLQLSVFDQLCEPTIPVTEEQQQHSKQAISEQTPKIKEWGKLTSQKLE